MNTSLATTATVVKTLGHRGRLRILALLAHGQTSVCQMAAAMKIPVSTMSGLLLELRHGGLVQEERRGKWVFYSLLHDAPARGLLDVVLAQIRTDPQVRKDAAAAARLRTRSPDAACAAAGVTHGAKGKR
jgi:ArsR family transcriptional regulator, arsenate/arsenite/antimonite-responsive transcriptional repressor